MKRTLLAAGIYNLLWSASIVLFPLAPFRWAGMEDLRYPELWHTYMQIGAPMTSTPRIDATSWPRDRQPDDFRESR